MMKGNPTNTSPYINKNIIKSTASKIAIIAGNGPSLREIDYRRFAPPPQKYDVFRCNQFYFEDKYYLGKDVEYIFYNPSVFFESYYTTKSLIQKSEYSAQNIVCSSTDFKKIELKYYSGVLEGNDIIENLVEFHSFTLYNEIYENRRATSSVYMSAIATALGYKVLYLAGIDFYEGEAYGFDINQKNIMDLRRNQIKKSHIHTKEFDIEALEFLAKHYDVKIYSLCPNSPLSKYFPLAPLAKDRISFNFTPESKGEDYTSDILIPPAFAYEKVKKGKDPYAFRKNSVLRFLLDVKRTPKHVREFLQYKKREKRKKRDSL